MYHFFAYVSKLKYIVRWGLKRNVEPENVKEHSFDVAVIAHALANIRNHYFGGNVDASQICVVALFHDASEVLTGDLPGPIKYFNPRLAEAYKQVEKAAEEKLISMLPPEMQESYAPYILHGKVSDEVAKLVKAADMIAAYIKVMQEVDAGNHEFTVARERVEKRFREMALPEVDYFLEHYLPSFRLTLDELG
ncbi:Predicted hydrolase of HD superfamily [gamma proteobacterium HdN1]|nr:Predicted hydrolase of HD superfamily [gamma proteobacterium HdN1]